VQVPLSGNLQSYAKIEVETEVHRCIFVWQGLFLLDGHGRWWVAEVQFVRVILGGKSGWGGGVRR